MTAQVDQFCAWAQPLNGTYINADAWSALSVWKSAQFQLAGNLVPGPGEMLLTAAELDAALNTARELPRDDDVDTAFWLSRYIEALVLKKQRALFAASIAQEAAP